ncbi:MAG: competence/damage-inducible protein A [Deltaproteobacteria bacterium]|nr:competence/damage-inducible protein A [Deltaproteobacteria bacterium]
MDDTLFSTSTAGVVVIGNEILTGKTVDTNSSFLCLELTKLGVQMERLITIPDRFDEIGAAVREFSQAYTWVFTSGGIGPTHDDITIPAIAAAFEVPVVRNAVLEEGIRRHFRERLTEDHLLMAQAPEGSELISVEGLNYPQLKFRNIFIFPGVPELFRHKFNAIKERFRARPVILHQFFLHADEGVIAATLRKAAERHPEVLIGSYPNLFRKEYSVKVTVEGREHTPVAAAVDELRRGLALLSVTLVREEP